MRINQKNFLLFNCVRVLGSAVALQPFGACKVEAFQRFVESSVQILKFFNFHFKCSNPEILYFNFSNPNYYYYFYYYYFFFFLFKS